MKTQLRGIVQTSPRFRCLRMVWDSAERVKGIRIYEWTFWMLLASHGHSRLCDIDTIRCSSAFARCSTLYMGGQKIVWRVWVQDLMIEGTLTVVVERVFSQRFLHSKHAKAPLMLFHKLNMVPWDVYRIYADKFCSRAHAEGRAWLCLSMVWLHCRKPCLFFSRTAVSRHGFAHRRCWFVGRVFFLNKQKANKRIDKQIITHAFAFQKRNWPLLQERTWQNCEA